MRNMRFILLVGIEKAIVSDDVELFLLKETLLPES